MEEISKQNKKNPIQKGTENDLASILDQFDQDVEENPKKLDLSGEIDFHPEKAAQSPSDDNDIPVYNLQEDVDRGLQNPFGEKKTVMEYIYGSDDSYEESVFALDDDSYEKNSSPLHDDSDHPRVPMENQPKEEPKPMQEPHFLPYVGASEFYVPEKPMVGHYITGVGDNITIQGSGSPLFEAFKKAYQGAHSEALLNKPFSECRPKELASFKQAFNYLIFRDTEPFHTEGKARVRCAATELADKGHRLLETCRDDEEQKDLVEKMKLECLRNSEFRDYLTDQFITDTFKTTQDGKPNRNAAAAMELYCFALTAQSVSNYRGEDILAPGKMESRDPDRDSYFLKLRQQVQDLDAVAGTLRARLEKAETQENFDETTRDFETRISTYGPERTLLDLQQPKSASVTEATYVPKKSLTFVLQKWDDNGIARGTGTPEFQTFAQLYQQYHLAENDGKRDFAEGLFIASCDYLFKKDTSPFHTEGKQRVAAAVRAMADSGLKLLSTCSKDEERKWLVEKMKIECLRNKEFRSHLLRTVPNIIQDRNKDGQRNANGPIATQLYSFALVIDGICRHNGKDALVTGKMDGIDGIEDPKCQRANQIIRELSSTVETIAQRLEKNVDNHPQFHTLSETFKRSVEKVSVPIRAEGPVRR